MKNHITASIVWLQFKLSMCCPGAFFIIEKDSQQLFIWKSIFSCHPSIVNIILHGSLVLIIFFSLFTRPCIYLQQVLGIIPNRECWILLLTACSSFSKWILLQVNYLWHNSVCLVQYNRRSPSPCNDVELVILTWIYWDKGISNSILSVLQFCFQNCFSLLINQ